jgi:lysine-specific demethylase 3
MKKEVEHASQASCSRISRDVTVINNCDTCLHVILCGSWICHVCAREVCFDCYSTLIALEEENRRLGGGGRGQDQSLALEGVSTATLTTLVKCGKIPHKSSNFAPLTRIDLDKLKSTAQEMEDWRKTHPVQPAKELPQGWIDRFYHQPHEEENSHPYLKLPSNLLPPTQDQYVTALPNTLPPALLGDDPLDALLSPPPSVATLPEGFSTFDFFQSVWSRGEAMVVDIDLSEVSSIDWSPEYFIEKFGSHKVTIGSNLPGGRDKKETVGSFFSRFGRGSRSNTSDKIKVSFYKLVFSTSTDLAVATGLASID